MRGRIILDRRVGEILRMGWGRWRGGEAGHRGRGQGQRVGIAIKVAWRKDRRLSRKTAFGVPTCTLNSGPPGVSVPELSHDFWISGVALVGGGVGLCPRLC